MISTAGAHLRNLYYSLVVKYCNFNLLSDIFYLAQYLAQLFCQFDLSCSVQRLFHNVFCLECEGVGQLVEGVLPALGKCVPILFRTAAAV